jgi:hypothetical protein
MDAERALLILQSYLVEVDPNFENVELDIDGMGVETKS